MQAEVMLHTIREPLLGSLEDVEVVLIVEVPADRASRRMKDQVQREQVRVAVGVGVGFEVRCANQTVVVVVETEADLARRVGESAQGHASPETARVLSRLVAGQYQVVRDAGAGPVREAAG